MALASNFLIKSEAKYIPFSPQNTTNEDLSQIVNANNKHMTFCVNWKAVLNDNGKPIRVAVGQHFVQIDHLFETFFCPLRREAISFDPNKDILGIYDYKKYLENQAKLPLDIEWLDSNMIVSSRCFLEEGRKMG